jgi:hypothetical protein
MEKLTFCSTNFLRWSDFVFRRWLSVSWRRKSLQFIEIRNLLQHLQQSATFSFPVPRLIHSTPRILPDFFQIEFLYNLTHGLLTWFRLFSLLCTRVLYCSVTFYYSVVLFFFCVLYCSLFLYCTVSACDVRAATLTEVFPCFFLSCKANAWV